VRDPFAELGLGGEVLRQMDRIASPVSCANPTTSEAAIVFDSVSVTPTERSSK
jgi:hypothetical protein